MKKSLFLLLSCMSFINAMLLAMEGSHKRATIAMALESEQDTLNNNLFMAVKKCNICDVIKFLKMGADVKNSKHELLYEAFSCIDSDEIHDTSARDIVIVLIEAGAKNWHYKNHTPVDSLFKYFEPTEEVIDSVAVALATTVTPDEVQHIIPMVIALKFKMSDVLGVDIYDDAQRLLKETFIRVFINTKLAAAKKMLYDALDFLDNDAVFRKDFEETEPAAIYMTRGDLLKEQYSEDILRQMIEDSLLRVLKKVPYIKATQEAPNETHVDVGTELMDNGKKKKL